MKDFIGETENSSCNIQITSKKQIHKIKENYELIK